MYLRSAKLPAALRPEYSREEVASSLGLTKSQVAEAERSAVRKLQTNPDARALLLAYLSR